MPALSNVAFVAMQPVQLVLRLHPFRHDFKPQFMTDIDSGNDNFLIYSTAADPADQRFIYFEHV